MDVPIERREPFLPVAVDVLGQLVARLLDGLKEGGEQRARGRPALEDERTLVAAVRIVGRRSEARLHSLEIRQAVRVVPGLHAGIRRPSFVVERVAALEDLAVDARGAAEDLAASVVDPPAVHERLGLRLVAPIVESAADREGERRRHVDEDVEPVIRPAGFEDQDARPRIGGEAIGQGAAGRAATDDDEVVARRHGLRC